MPNEFRSSVARLTSNSIDGLEGLTAELQELQDFLKSEVERVQGDIESALAGIKIIIETIAPWKSTRCLAGVANQRPPCSCGPGGEYRGRAIASLRPDPGLVARGLLGICARRNELLLDLLVNPAQPFLGARGAILRLRKLRLQLLDAILGGAQLDGNPVRQAHGAVAVFVRQGGGLLQQRNDRFSGLIQRIAVTTRRFVLGRELHDLLGYVGRARVLVSLPTVSALRMVIEA